MRRRGVHGEGGAGWSTNTPNTNEEHTQKSCTQEHLLPKKRTHRTHARTQWENFGQTLKHEFWPNLVRTKKHSSLDKFGLAKFGHDQELANFGFFWPSSAMTQKKKPTGHVM